MPPPDSAETELAREIRELRLALGKVPVGGGWIDRKVITVILLGWIGSAVGLGILGLWGTGGLRDQIGTALTSSTQNAVEIRRVEADSRERDHALDMKLDRTFEQHMQYQHGGTNGRRSTGMAPPMMLPIWPAAGVW